MVESLAAGRSEAEICAALRSTLKSGALLMADLRNKSSSTARA